MSKKNRKNERFTFKMTILIVVFLLLSIFIPSIKTTSDSPKLLIEIVQFFKASQNHIMYFWTIYTFIIAIIYAYLTKNKKFKEK